MTSPRQILARCGRKRRYPTQEAAAAGMALRLAAGALGLSTYACPHCGAWHFGKRKNWWRPQAVPGVPLIVPVARKG